MTKADGGGFKLSIRKPKTMFHLIPREWIWGLADLLTKGALKYAPKNWERGMVWSEVWRAIFSHLDKWRSGELYDDETGTHHLVAAAWNCLVLFSMQLRGIGTNDLDGDDFKIDIADPTIKYEDIKNVLPKEHKT